MHFFSINSFIPFLSLTVLSYKGFSRFTSWAWKRNMVTADTIRTVVGIIGVCNLITFWIHVYAYACDLTFSFFSNQETSFQAVFSCLQCKLLSLSLRFVICVFWWSLIWVTWYDIAGQHLWKYGRRDQWSSTLQCPTWPHWWIAWFGLCMAYQWCTLTAS